MPGLLPLSRFAFTRSWISRIGGGFRFKYQAFMPRAAHGRPLELLVFRVDGLNEEEIWTHARKYALPPGRNIHGRADMPQAAIAATDPLHVDYDDSPPRHANVVGWPKEKDEQLALAQDLASVARSVRPPQRS